MIKTSLAKFAALSALALLTSFAQAEDFPTRAVKLTSPFPAGSGPDAVGRIVGEKMGIEWKQSIIIDPKPGANGFLAIGAVKQAPPTGYELLLADVGHLSISHSLFKKLPYDPKADFVPVAGLYRTSFFIVVGAHSPYQNVKELLAAANAKPGKITYGSNSVGGPLHLGAAQVEAASNTKMVHVPYKEISQLYAAVSTGEVDWAIGSLASAGPLFRAGKVKLIAIADTNRSTALPNVPTFEEATGLKGVEARTWVVLMAPKGTPAAVVNAVNTSMENALKQPDVMEKLAGFGFVPFVTTPAAISAMIDKDTLTYAAMVKRTGASAD